MFSDQMFSASEGANKVFSKNMIDWLSGERGSLRRTFHHTTCVNKEGRVTDCVKGCLFNFTLDLEHWNWKQQAWQPYSDSEINLELIQISTKLRQRLQEDPSKKGHYFLQSNVPHRMGTYRVKISHSRPGWNRLNLYDKILVRNENFKEEVKNWPADIAAAVGIVCVWISFAFISYVFLYSDDRLKLNN